MLSSSHGRNTPRERPLSRSKSIVGSIKSLFTGFFRANDDIQEDFEHSKGKRKALDQGGPDVSMDRIDESGSRTKRMRIGSPGKGYLDPPASVFEQPSSQFNFSFTPPSHSSNLSIHSPTIPSPNSHRPNAIHVSRTMSMDPPSRYSRHLTRDVSMSIHDEPSMAANQSHRMSVPIPRMSMSIPRDLSMRDLSLPPLRSSPLRMSLTPHNFGPSPLRRERPPSEPPALTTLISNPMFVKPPLESQHAAPDRQSTVTLGSLVDSRRSTRSPARTLNPLFGSQPSMSDISSTPTRVNPAEKLLNDLEAYRTPFLPSRLRDSSATNIVPGMSMYERERSGTPILMQDRSGGSGRRRSGKNKSKKETKREREAERERERERENEGKPYAGEGGMKKLLSRRKMEAAEEEERRMMDDSPPKAKRETKDASVHTESPADPAPSVATKKVPPSPVPAPSKVSTPNGGVEQSSLRVGRARTQRSHTPSARLPNKNRFSAVYEDVEGDGDGEDEERRERERKELEEAAKKVPEFKILSGFSFANDAPTSTPPPQQQKDGSSKDGPIATLPFSFEGPRGSASPFDADVVPSLPVNDTPRRLSITTDFSRLPSQPPASEPKLVPTFSLQSQPPITESPAPTPPKSLDLSAPPAASSVPNFFSNSALLQPSFATPPVKSGDGKKSSSHARASAQNVENPLATGKEGNGESNEPAAGLLTGGPPKQLAAGLFGGQLVKPVAGVSGGPPKPNGGSLFGDTLPVREPQSVPGFTFGAPPKSDGSPAPQRSAFGSISTPPASFIPAEDAAPVPPPISSPNPFGPPLRTSGPSTTGASFSFDEKAAPTADAAKPPPPFGNVPAFSFGSPSLTAQTAPPAPSPELLQPTFSFGQSSAPPTPVPDDPKPLFGGAGGFSFGQPSPSTSTPALPAQDKDTLKTPFAFGATPSTPPAIADKKPTFSFGAPDPVPAPPAAGSGFSFGSNTPSTDGPKPFSFGSGATLSRPVTPPKNNNNEQEMRMEESPTRETQVKPATVNGFSFGSSTLFGQGTQSQGQGQSPSPFSFGGSNNNPFGSKTEAKPQENKPTSSGFGGFGQQTSSSSSGFTFGQQQKVSEPEQPRPSTAGSFSFGGGQQTSTPTQPSFSFGAPTTTAGNAFNGQPTSAPNSPSSFSQPGGFSFTSSNAQPSSSGFSFGASQPASPVNGNVNQVQPQTPAGGGFSFGQASSGDSGQKSPFSTAPPAGGALFTIGSAPPAQRQIKKLPNRRMGGAKR